MNQSNTHSQKNTGFTMVEIMTVFAILVILFSLGMFASSRLVNQAHKKETMTTMSELLNAIEVYKEETGSYPGGSDWISVSSVIGSLKDCNQSLELLANIELDGGKDSFGREMRFSATGGIGGGPCIVSAGPDGVFGPASGGGQTAGDVKFGYDDIRSDQFN